jgi:hypothetical protein
VLREQDLADLADLLYARTDIEPSAGNISTDAFEDFI